MAEFQVWDQRGEDIEFFAQADGPRAQALAMAREYAIQIAAEGGTAIIEEVTRVEVERLSGAALFLIRILRRAASSSS